MEKWNSVMSSLLWRVNPVTILAAGIAIAGLFLPWWGIEVTGTTINRFRLQWTIWNPPRLARMGASTLSWNITLTSTIVLALALVAASLVVVGSLTLIRKYLLTGLILSIASLGLYTIVLDYITMNYCLISTLCSTGPIGTAPLPGVQGLTVAWGFQIGFYITLLAILTLSAGLLLNHLVVRENITRRSSEIQTQWTEKNPSPGIVQLTAKESGQEPAPSA